MKVLVADEDKSLLDITSFALHRYGFAVITATNGTQALHCWETDRPDVAVLESTLPKLSGLEVCRRIREEKDTPILMMGSSQDDESVEKAFRLGADDYVTKPFSHRQLALRIRAISRRKSPTSGDQHQSGRLAAASLVLDLDSNQAARGNVIARLTPIEFRILYMLAVNEGRAVPSRRLAEYAWAYDGGDPSLLKTHIYHLRRKLQMRNGEPGTIKSIPRIGYMLGGS